MAGLSDESLLQGSAGPGPGRGRPWRAAPRGCRAVPGVVSHDQTLAAATAGVGPSGRLPPAGRAGPQDRAAPGGLAAATRGAARCHPRGALRPVGAGHRRPGLDSHDEPGDQPRPRLDPEKKSLSASERDEAAREAWRERAAAIDPARWVWGDEFGSHTALTRTHARSRRGTRARGSAPRNRRPNRTTIASLT